MEQWSIGTPYESSDPALQHINLVVYKKGGKGTSFPSPHRIALSRLPIEANRPSSDGSRTVL
jgi:hypothetical protein